MLRVLLVPVLLALLSTPLAAAGTQEAPELTDPAGDCANAAGNEYLDVVAAWVSDETEHDFRVNIALAKFVDTIAMGAGITVQFSHQGVQFGVVALYQGSPGWYYGNALVNEEGVSEVRDADGSFTPGEPAILSIQFFKDNFPHGDMTDNEIRSFFAATTDFKPLMPFLIAGQNPPVAAGTGQGDIPCDSAEGSGTYTFQVGGHAAHSGGDMDSGDNATAEAGADASANATASTGSGDPLVPQAAAGDKDTPAPALALVLVALLALARLRRR